MSADDAHLTALARAVEGHVPVQPSSSYGFEPVPVELSFSTHLGTPRWTVRFVVSASTRTRKWANVTRPTITGALEAAREIQTRGFAGA